MREVKTGDRISYIQIVRLICGEQEDDGVKQKQTGSRGNKWLELIREYGVLTFSTALVVIGVYFFKFPNNFSFGGVTGYAVVLGKVMPFTPSDITFVFNIALLVVGFLFLGRSFGIKTVYVSILMSVGLAVLEKVCPLNAPLTDEPLLELLFAIFLPGLGSAILFNVGASSGGTDIIAMILKKYTAADIGTSLFLVDLLVVIASFFLFDIRTGLFSFCGLMAKSLVIDSVIESINLCKYFNVVCDEPEPICDYIINELHRSATICRAEGAFTKEDKAVIMTVMSRTQAVLLRNYIKKVEPSAFMLISNTSEIIGKGFHSV